MGLTSLYINGTRVPYVYIDTSGSFNKPDRVVETISVPGRNGDLYIDGGKYNNVIITYPAYIRENFESKWRGIINMLGNSIRENPGYQRITTSADTTHFRLGRVIMPQTPTVIRANQDAFFDLSFDCKPERFLVAGEDLVTFTSDGTLSNPTLNNAKPLLRIYGSGSVTINGDTITIGQTGTQYVDIDCEKMDCYYGTVNMNQFVTFSQNDFPELLPYTNTITLGGSVVRVRITPRWWEL